MDNILDKIYSEGDSLCWKCHGMNNWTDLEIKLQSVDTENESVNVILAWLIISRWAKNKINYSEYYEKVAQRLKDDPEKDAILIGLDP